MHRMTMINRVTPSQLADLAMHIDQADPIDWGMLSIKEEDAYLMMAQQVLDIMTEAKMKNLASQQIWERYLAS